jgi:hypothetical protein
MASNIVKKSFTFDEFIRETQKTLPEGYSDKYRQSSVNGDKDFTGTKSFAEATRYLKYGWPEGVAELKTELDNIKKVTAPALECIFDVAGEEPDIGRFLSGEPENMVEYQTVNRDGIKFVDIYVSYAFHCGWEVEEAVRRGATILANVDGLEANGYRCRIIGYQSASSGDVGSVFEVFLKDYNETLELDRMAFCLVNPSMFRRLGFKLDELHQPELSNRSYGSGMAFEAPKNALHIERDMFSPKAINSLFADHLKNAK